MAGEIKTLVFSDGVETEAPDGFLLVTNTYQASLGTQVELPWALKLRTMVEGSDPVRFRAAR